MGPPLNVHYTRQMTSLDFFLLARLPCFLCWPSLKINNHCAPPWFYFSSECRNFPGLKRFKRFICYIWPWTGVVKYNNTKIIFTYIHEVLKFGIMNFTTNMLNANVKIKIHSMLKCLWKKKYFIHFWNEW